MNFETTLNLCKNKQLWHLKNDTRIICHWRGRSPPTKVDRERDRRGAPPSPPHPLYKYRFLLESEAFSIIVHWPRTRVGTNDTTHAHKGSRPAQHITHKAVQASSFTERRPRRLKCSLYLCYCAAQVFGCAIVAVKSRIASRSCSFCDQNCSVSFCKSDSAFRIQITWRSKYIKANPSPTLANKFHEIGVASSRLLPVSKGSFWILGGDCSVVGSSTAAAPVGLAKLPSRANTWWSILTYPWNQFLVSWRIFFLIMGLNIVVLVNSIRKVTVIVRPPAVAPSAASTTHRSWTRKQSAAGTPCTTVVFSKMIP